MQEKIQYTQEFYLAENRSLVRALIIAKIIKHDFIELIYK